MQCMSKLSKESHFQVFHSYSASWLECVAFHGLCQLQQMLRLYNCFHVLNNVTFTILFDSVLQHVSERTIVVTMTHMLVVFVDVGTMWK
jgi:hypothetical protein